MKKIRTLLICVILLFAMALCSCNQSCGIGSLSFRKVHIDTYHYSGCYEIISWYDNSTGIEAVTREFGSIYLSEGTYILISSECPICD